MGGLFAKNQSGPAIDRLAGMAVSQSVYGVTLPVVYGKARVPINLLDYGDFWSRENKTETQTGGKGGSQEQTTGYSYFASIIGALCEGQINGIGRVWVDKDVRQPGDIGLNIFYGTAYQSPWQIWATKHPERAMSYAGVAYVSSVDFALNSSGGMPNINVEVFGKFSGDHSSGCAKPANVLVDILTDTSHGLALDPALVAPMTGASGYRAYCDAEGFYLARAFADQKSAAEHIAEIMDATNSTIMVRPSGGGMVIDVLPLCGHDVSNDGVDFAPSNLPLIDISIDDVVGMFDDDGNPDVSEFFGVSTSKTQDSEAYNARTVNFSDISREYNDASATECDDGDASAFGLKRGEALDLKCIPTYSHASKICKYKNTDACIVRDKYVAKIPINLASVIYPGLLVTLTSEAHGLYYSPMMVWEMDEPAWPSDTTGGGPVMLEGVAVTMRPWTGAIGATQIARGGVAGAGDGWLPLAPVSPSPGGSSPSSPPGSSVDPGDAFAPYIFEPPPGLAGSGHHLWIATTGGEYWGGCNVHVSLDGGVSYAKIGKITARAKYGYATTQITAGAGQALGVLLDGYQPATLDGTSSQGLAAGATASIVGGEAFAFTTSTMTAQSAYTLSGLRRAMYGTKSQIHGVGERFCRLDDAIFKYKSKDEISGDIKIKLQSFNIFSSGLKPLESCAEYTYTIDGRQWPASDSVVVELLSSRPSMPNSAVFIDGEWSLGVLNDSNSAALIGQKWVKVTWAWDGSPPAGGFEIMLHSSTPPNYSEVIAMASVDPSIRTAIFTVCAPSITAIYASVRSVNE